MPSPSKVLAHHDLGRLALHRTPASPPLHEPRLSRRACLGTLAVWGASVGLVAHAAPAGPANAAPAKTAAPAPAIPLELWKDPQCGCCDEWVQHMQSHGFAVTVHASGNNAVRTRLGLPAKLGSCHTALVGGYLVEGHVPASAVHSLLRTRPQALGLTVPGMPVGSPGMDGAVYGGRRDAYDVLLVARDGSTRIFSRHNQPGSKG